MALDSSVTVSLASADVSTYYQLIKLPGAGPEHTSPQLARVFVTAAASGTPSGTGYARFALVDTTGATPVLVGAVEATLTAQTGTPNRTAIGGGSGSYALVITFPNGSDTLDLNGADVGGGLRWYVGIAAFPTNVTACTFGFSHTNVT
jgi:hypothetical protein